MSDLINYLPCLKCDSSSNIIRIDYYDKEDCLYLKLSCIKKCSDNYIKFSDLINLLKNQKKIPISIFVYGNYSKENKKIESISDKIINYYNKLYSDFEIIEKNIANFKENIKSEINKIKRNFESLKLLNELIFGAYLKNIKDNLDKDNNFYLKNNLKHININNEMNLNNKRNFYVKEIEKDISKINNSFNYIKTEFSEFLKLNQLSPINLFPKINNNSINIKEKHDLIETYRTSIKNIKSIIYLNDGNIALGSDTQLIIYNLYLKKEIDYIPGEFSYLRELKYSQKYKSDNNNIIVLSLLNKSIRIYNVNEKTLLLNYVQNSSIDNVLELYNGDILYINDYSIYNLSLSKEFKIPLKYFCFCMINLVDKQNILGYTYQKYIKFIYLDNPKKIYKKIEISDYGEIFDVKQIYNENKNYNFLIILSKHRIDLYDLNLDNFFLCYNLNRDNFYKKIDFAFDENHIMEKFFIIGENYVKIFIYKENQLINFQNIAELKNVKTSLYSKIVTTPFCYIDNKKYLVLLNNKLPLYYYCKIRLIISYEIYKL